MRHTKMFEMYEEEMKSRQARSVSRKNFDKIRNDTGPNIQALPLRSDMCAACTKFQSIIGKRLIAPDKLSAINDQINAFKEHCLKVGVARKLYRDCVQKAKDAYKNRTYQNKKEHL